MPTGSGIAREIASRLHGSANCRARSGVRRANPNRDPILPSACAVILALVVSTAATAQSRTWEIGASAGGGPSVVTASLGGVSDRQLFTTTLFVSRPLLRWRRLSASYFGEIMPLVVATKVPKLLGSWFPNRSPTDSTYVVFPWGD